MNPCPRHLLPGLDDIDATIASLVAQGMPNRQIAEHVFLSYQTVRNRVSRIFDLTGVSNRTQLALKWSAPCVSCPDAACPANPAAPL